MIENKDVVLLILCFRNFNFSVLENGFPFYLVLLKKEPNEYFF